MGVNYESSWVQICNRALSRLGASVITDLSEESRDAEYCTIFLPEAIEEVLGQYNFSWSIDRRTLAPNEDKPEFGWKNRFNMPMDFLRLISVDAEPYKVENRRVLADADEVKIVYVRRPENPDDMPESVRRAVSTALAAKLATAITSNEQLIALTLQEKQQAIAEAKREDAALNYDPEAKGVPLYEEAR